MLQKLQTRFRYILYLLSIVIYDPSTAQKIITKKRVDRIKLKNKVIIVGDVTSLIPEIVEEIFYKKVYTPNFLNIHPGDTVVDIGANIGIFSVFANMKGAGKIIAIEPLFQNIKVMRKNFKLNGIKNSVVVEAAIARKTGRTKYYLRKFDAHGGISSKNQFVKEDKTIMVKTLTWSEMTSRFKIDVVDFLKIDCEGGEGEIISEMSMNDWEKIRSLAMEYHNDLSALSHEEMIDVLEKVGFETRLKRMDEDLGYIYAWRAKKL